MTQLFSPSHSLNTKVGPLTFLIFVLGFQLQGMAQTITVNAFTPVICAGSINNLSIPITKTGTFTGNAFRAELSQPAPTLGFTPPTITGNNSNVPGSNGFVNLVIPAATSFGQYQIRVVHVGSGTISNIVNFTITPPYTVDLVNNSALCATDTIRFGLNMGPAPYYTSLSLGSSTRRWKRNGTIIAGQTATTITLLPNQYRAGDIISAEVRTNSGCFGGPAAAFVVTRSDTLNGIKLDSLANRRVCPGQVVNLNWSVFKAPTGNYVVQLSDTLGRFNPPSDVALVTGFNAAYTIPVGILQKPNYRYAIRVIVNTITNPVFCDKSNSIPILVGSATASASFLASADSVCSGTPITYTGNSLGFTAPQYIWTVNGVQQATTPNLTLNSPNNRDTVRLVVSGATTCGNRTVVVPFQLTRVLPIPTRPTLFGDTVCGQGAVTLRATPPPTGEAIRWYNNNNFLVGTGNSFRTNTLTASTTFTAKAFNGICEGPTSTITAVVIPIPQKPSIAGFALPDTTVCAGEQIQLQSAVGASRYLWSTGATTPSITVTQGGKYTLNVYNDNCISPTSDTIRVTYRQPLVAPQISQSNPVCGSGITTLFINNPDPALTYFWYDASGTTLVGSGTGLALNLTQTVSYSVAASLGRCTSTPTPIDATVTPLPPKPTISSSKTQLCPGSTATLTASPGYTNYVWTDGVVGQTREVSSAGAYALRVTDGICQSPVSDSITISGSGLQAIDLGPNLSTTLQSAPTTLTASPAGGVWQGMGVLSGTNVFDPTIAGIGKHTLTYTISSGACSAVKTIEVEVTEGPVVINNFFSPNGDGQNDTWEYNKLMYQYSGIKVLILNRYGVKLYESLDSKTAWDGIVGGSKVLSGTYIYLITFPDGRLFRGTVEVVY
jgi:gliding motility-associated-like protein